MLDYLRDVLGINYFLQPRGSFDVFVFCDVKSPQESELLKRMLDSIGLKEVSVKPMDQLNTGCDLGCALVLADHPEMLANQVAQSKAIVTYSPRKLLENSQLKRQVWEDLKKFKKHLT
jgi:hypothetical protein